MNGRTKYHLLNDVDVVQRWFDHAALMEDYAPRRLLIWELADNDKENDFIDVGRTIL